MPQAESYAVIGQLPVTGVVVGDFNYIIDGRIRPVILKTGDVINLEQVDIDGFARSSQIGILSGMEVGGTLKRVLVDVSEKTYDALRMALEKYPRPEAPGRYPHATEVVSIEPGVQVAISGKGPQMSDNQQVENASTPVEPPQNVQTAAVVDRPEPGLQVGQTPVDDSLPTPMEEVQEEKPSWKDGKTLAEQEQFLKENTDVEFLTQVAGDSEESKRLRRLAQNRLKELKS